MIRRDVRGMKGKGIAVIFILVILLVSGIPTGIAASPGASPSDQAANRAGNLPWVVTDWAVDGANATDGIITSVPGVLVLGTANGSYSLVFTDGSRSNAPALAVYNGELYVATTNYPDPSGTGAIWRFDARNSTFVQARTFPDDGILEMSVSGGKLLVPGVDSDRTSGNGNITFFDGTSWTTKTTVPNGLEVYDALYYQDLLYADATTTDGVKTNGRGDAKVFRSDTDGDTWVMNKNFDASAGNARAAYDMEEFDGQLFIQVDGNSSTGPFVQVTNFTNWYTEPIKDLPSSPGKFAGFNGSLYLLAGNHVYKRVVAGGGPAREWVLLGTPFATQPFTTEEYVPASSSWTGGSGGLNVPRSGAGAVLLTNNKVLVSGGLFGSTITSSAETLDPATGNWTLTGDMGSRRMFHTLTALGDGRALAMGGFSGLKGTPMSSINTVETYDPATGTWTPRNTLGDRAFHTATLINDGRVLVCGGVSGSYLNPAAGVIRSDCAFFNPTTNLWVPTTAMPTARYGHTATMLSNQTILFVGGITTGGIATAAVVLFDPTSGIWTTMAPLDHTAAFHSAVIMANDMVVSGGLTQNGPSLDLTAATSLWDNAGASWVVKGTLSTARAYHASLFMGGTAMVLGGTTASGPTNTVETYSSGAGTWASGQSMTVPRANLTALILQNGTGLVVGGVGVVGGYGTGTYVPYTDSTTRAIVSTDDRLYVGMPDGSVFGMNTTGAWRAEGKVGSGGESAESMAIYNGRLFLGTSGLGGSSVYVASSLASGTMVSKPRDLGQYISNGTLSWNAVTPAGTAVSFRARSARTLLELNNTTFKGPDGTASTYYTTSGTALSSTLSGGRYLQYEVKMTSSVQNSTPILNDILFDLNAGPLRLTALTVSPSDIIITADQITQFNASGFDQFGIPFVYPVTWTSTGGSIDDTGLFIPTKVGTWQVVASSSSVKGTANVTVTPGDLNRVTVTPAQNTTGEIVMKTGEPKGFRANGRDSKGNDVAFDPTWGVTGGGTIGTGTGQNITFSATTPGRWTLFANGTNATGAKISGNITIRILEGDIASVTVTPSTATITADQSIVLTATGFDKVGNPLDVFPVWDVPLDAGTFDVNGATMNLSAEMVGTWAITANVTGIAGTANVTITPGALATLAIEPKDVTLKAGENITFNLTAKDNDGNDVSVNPTWTVSGGATITGPSFSTTSVGTYMVMVTQGGLSAEGHILVVPGDLDHLVIVPSDIVLDAMNITSFSVTAYDAYGNAIPGVEVVWTTSGGIGFIDTNGILTVGSDSVKGSVTATVTLRDKSLSGDANVEVKGRAADKENWVMPGYYSINGLLIIIMLLVGFLAIIIELLSIKVRKGRLNEADAAQLLQTQETQQAQDRAMSDAKSDASAAQDAMQSGARTETARQDAEVPGAEKTKTEAAAAASGQAGLPSETKAPGK